ncbi:MAG: hypothetical protein JSR73_03785, partial [Proteobacteria bacterium]|nr:hypothetical protein [Pseudomonadota bacterium]
AAPARVQSILEEAYARLVAQTPEPGRRALAPLAETLGRLLASAPPGATAPLAAEPAASARALRLLTEELRRVLAATLGTEPALLPPAPGEDAATSAAALLGWLRTLAARAGLPPGQLAAAVDVAAARALAELPAESPAPAEALLATRTLIGRGLGVEPLPLVALGAALEAVAAETARAPVAPLPALPSEPGAAAGAVASWLRGTVAAPLAPRVLELATARALGTLGAAAPPARALVEAVTTQAARLLEAPAATPTPLYRPDLPLPARAAGAKVPRATDPDRVAAIGEEEREPAGGEGAREDEAGEAGASPGREAATEGPMQCARATVEALAAGDAAALGACWVFPAGVWRDGRWSVAADPASLLRLLANGTARLLLLRVEPQGARAATVHALLEEAGAGGRREAELLFLAVRAPRGWRLATAVRKE